MKRRWAWRWRLTYAADPTTIWWGTCPRWAAQPVPVGATLTRHRVLVVGTIRDRCTVLGCGDSHLRLGQPGEGR